MPERLRVRRIRTMLVDDDPAFRCLVRAELEGSGRFEVVAEARDGADAVAQAGTLQGRLDLVLLDLDMPVMDGLTALPLIVALMQGARVVVLSMRDGVGLHDEVLRLGGADCVHKALQGDALVARLVAPRMRRARTPPVPQPAR